MTAITNTECKMTYGNQITDGMVCAIGNYNEGTCVVSKLEDTDFVAMRLAFF